MQKYDLAAMSQPGSEKPSGKLVFEGVTSKAMLLQLASGQEVPIHPHPGWEVTLVPQSGVAIACHQDGTQTPLITGSVYYGGVSPTFGVRNDASENFSTIVFLVRSAEPIVRPPSS